jgi:hypothetical protein
VEVDVEAEAEEEAEAERTLLAMADKGQQHSPSHYQPLHQWSLAAATQKAGRNQYEPFPVVSKGSSSEYEGGDNDDEEWEAAEGGEDDEGNAPWEGDPGEAGEEDWVEGDEDGWHGKRTRKRTQKHTTKTTTKTTIKTTTKTTTKQTTKQTTRSTMKQTTHLPKKPPVPRQFPRGTRVEALWDENDKVYFPGMIISSNLPNNTYEIQFDDGDHDEAIHASVVRRLVMGKEGVEVAESTVWDEWNGDNDEAVDLLEMSGTADPTLSEQAEAAPKRKKHMEVAYHADSDRRSSKKQRGSTIQDAQPTPPEDFVQTVTQAEAQRQAQERAIRMEQEEAWAENQAQAHAQAQARIRAQKQAEAQAIARATASKALAEKLRQQTKQQQLAQQQHWHQHQEEQQAKDYVEALRRAEALRHDSGVRGVCANNVQRYRKRKRMSGSDDDNEDDDGNDEPALPQQTWSAWCYREGKDHALGVFNSKEAASTAYANTIREWYGDIKMAGAAAQTAVAAAISAAQDSDDEENEVRKERETIQRRCAEREASAMGSYSGFHGVEMFGQRNWRAWLFVPKTNLAEVCKKTTLGVFDTKEEAAVAYDKAARERYGRGVKCNFGNVVSPRPGTASAIDGATAAATAAAAARAGLSLAGGELPLCAIDQLGGHTIAGLTTWLSAAHKRTQQEARKDVAGLTVINNVAATTTQLRSATTTQLRSATATQLRDNVISRAARTRDSTSEANGKADEKQSTATIPIPTAAPPILLPSVAVLNQPSAAILLVSDNAGVKATEADCEMDDDNTARADEQEQDESSTVLDLNLATPVNTPSTGDPSMQGRDRGAGAGAAAAGDIAGTDVDALTRDASPGSAAAPAAAEVHSLGAESRAESTSPHDNVVVAPQEMAAAEAPAPADDKSKLVVDIDVENSELGTADASNALLLGALQAWGGVELEEDGECV